MAQSVILLTCIQIVSEKMMINRIMKCGASIFMIATAACQTTSETPSSAGKGHLIINPRMAEYIREAHHDDRVVYDLHMAVDKKARNISQIFCDSPPPTLCVGNYDSMAEAAIAHCNRDGKFDCALLSIRQRFVWDGPISLYSGGMSGLIPFHGNWTYAASLSGETQVSGTLSARVGVVTLRGGGTLDGCQIQFKGSISGSGEATMKCGEREIAGNFRRGRNRRTLAEFGPITNPEVKMTIEPVSNKAAAPRT